jgi:hypothetical protein
MESVYWPAIPASVIAAANTLSATVADPVMGPALQRRLPPGLANAQVIIRHSPPMETTNFEAFASYEATSTGPMPRTRHFDATGAEFTMKSEQPPKIVPSTRRH